MSQIIVGCYKNNIAELKKFGCFYCCEKDVGTDLLCFFFVRVKTKMITNQKLK